MITTLNCGECAKEVPESEFCEDCWCCFDCCHCESDYASCLSEPDDDDDDEYEFELTSEDDKCLP